jgi:TonB family protein
MDSLSREGQRIFYLFIVAVLLVHMALMATKIREQFSPVVLRPEVKSIKLKLIQDHMKDVATSTKRQIVQSEDTVNNEKKKDAFLSDKTRSFDRETVSKNIDSFNRAAQGNSSITQKALTQEKSSKKAAIKNLKLSDIGMASGDNFPEKISRTPASEQIKGMKNGDPLAQGLSATNDYVEEVTLGDFTQLNTVEYKHYGFFHRIRQKLEQFWGRSIQEKAEAIFRSGRRLPASENLITNLQVTLNERGEIVAVKIVGASGVKELDDAAIESFNQAGPFPNPPTELLVNGKATIDWGFVIKS